MADEPVLVVGAGPVGLMIAGELALGGAEVVVWERLREPTGQSRASHLHARTMEIFDQRGLLAHLGEPPRDDLGHFGGVPLELDRLASHRPGLWRVSQARTEAVLGSWAAALGADIRRGYELSELTVAADHVEARGHGPAGPVRLRTRYLVGCDGQDSTVRRLAGFDVAGREPTRKLLRADVTGIDIPQRRLRRYPAGLVTAAGRGDGVTRLMVHESGRPAAGQGAPPGYAEVVAAWARVTGEEIGAGTPLWVDTFDDASRQATRYRLGRVLLAGDAAHVQPPVGAQAVNLGLQDAANLGWKLAAEACGWAPAGLLDSYHDERHPVGRRVLGAIEAQALLLFGGADLDPLRAVLGELLGYADVRAHLAAMVSGLDVAYGPGPLVGRRVPHWPLSTPAGPTSTTALLRTGRGVLLDLTGDAAHQAGLSASVNGWRDRLDLVTARHTGGPPDAGALLLRPDGHVAWSGAGGPGVVSTSAGGPGVVSTSAGGSEAVSIDATGPAGPDGLDVALRRWFGAPSK
ncbi:FAD-dependent monooxygenase [Plantactinospora sp. B6F1]|uniref:FAD-dependent monooxygenase n=1 Tax=Plantactinospora sp. B6F1 TaxID=3158971 RepID=UPI00102D132A